MKKHTLILICSLFYIGNIQSQNSHNYLEENQLEKSLKHLFWAFDLHYNPFNAIYGTTDDRKDVIDEVDIGKISPSKGVGILVNYFKSRGRVIGISSDSIAISSDKSYLYKKGRKYSLKTKKYSETKDLHESVRFKDQPRVIPSCTVFAVCNDIVMTAGHCISDMKEARAKRIVFGYKKLAPNKYEKEFSKRKIFKIRKIIDRGYDPIRGVDFAILKVKSISLGIKIPKSSILKLNLTQELKNNDRIYSIGYPLGLPMKVISNGRVSNSNNPNYFSSNLDIFSGASGSPIFNKKNKVVGIYSSGRPDIYKKFQGKFILKTFNDSEGEQISFKVKSINKVLNKHLKKCKNDFK